MSALLSPVAAFHAAASRSRWRSTTLIASEIVVQDTVDDLGVEAVQYMFSDVRSHYRTSGELDEGQVCRNMMVTRVDDFKLRMNRCHVGESKIHGEGLCATIAHL